MPARKLCQKFFQDALAPFHQYRQNALVDATVALLNGASLTLTSIGRFLPGQAQVKNKIKRVDRLLGNSALHNDIPLIFNNIIEMLTRQLSLVVIAVDWSGYPSQDYHVLRASLICDGRSLPLLSKVVPSSKQNNVLIQKEFLDELAKAIAPEKKVVIITDAGFQANWFQHVKMLDWSFIGRVRGNVKFRLQNMGEKWLHLSDMEGKNRPESLGKGTLTRTPGSRCDGYFYLYRKEAKGRKNKRSKGCAARPKAEKEQRVSAKEPWLIFSSSDDFKPREIMKLYSRRMQISEMKKANVLGSVYVPATAVQWDECWF
jgi:hypothetical protein